MRKRQVIPADSPSRWMRLKRTGKVAHFVTKIVWSGKPQEIACGRITAEYRAWAIDTREERRCQKCQAILVAARLKP